jgi:hypothetical protein
MPTRSCVCCNFSTKYKNVFDKHLSSKRHLDTQNNNTIMKFECNICSKKYKNRSGLWQHSQTCVKPPSEEVVSTNTTNMNIFIVEKMSELQKQMESMEKTLQSIAPSNNINIVNNFNLTFLNTHCSDAMNIDQFVDSVEFITKDYKEIEKHKHLIKGAKIILNEKLSTLPAKDLPVHCCQSNMNNPVSFYVRDNNQWKEECQSLIEYQMKYIDNIVNDEDKLAMVRFLEKYTKKFYDTYDDLNYIKTANLQDKMFVCQRSETQIDMLNEMTNFQLLCVEEIEQKTERAESQKTPSVISQEPI